MDSPKYIGIVVQPYHDRPAELEWVASGEDEELVSAETRRIYIGHKAAHQNINGALEPMYDIYERKRTSGSNQPPQSPNQSAT